MVKKTKKLGTMKVKSIEEIEGEKMLNQTPPEYIVVNGYVYERHGKVGDGAVTLSFELDGDVHDALDEYMKKNPYYVNKQELIREALRNAIKEKNL